MPSILSYRFQKLKRGLLARLVLFLPFLLPLLATSAPLTKTEFPGGAKSKTLIVFLPGIADTAKDFENKGFIADMRSRGITADAVAVDAHYGYYAKREIVERMENEVIAPARAAGYEEIWLVGISLGGFGSALYAVQDASKIAGMLLLSPYLGPDTLIDEIADAGGLNKWQPDAGADNPAQRAMWVWFKNQTINKNPVPRIHLGYGARDKFARANGLLGAQLPQSSVYTVAGAHDWRTWKKLWILFLENRDNGLR
jgi:pimeloyl-ACP methyl ester carboxylesterase